MRLKLNISTGSFWSGCVGTISIMEIIEAIIGKERVVNALLDHDWINPWISIPIWAAILVTCIALVWSAESEEKQLRDENKAWENGQTRYKKASL